MNNDYVFTGKTTVHDVMEEILTELIKVGLINMEESHGEE